MRNLEEADTDKAVDSVAKSVADADGSEQAQNQNDRMDGMYHNDVAESQLKEDTQQTEVMVLKAIADTNKEMLSGAQTDKKEPKAAKSEAT